MAKPIDIAPRDPASEPSGTATSPITIESSSDGLMSTESSVVDRTGQTGVERVSTSLAKPAVIIDKSILNEKSGKISQKRKLDLGVNRELQWFRHQRMRQRRF